MDISRVEKCLESVEDCYNRLVEVLSDESLARMRRINPNPSRPGIMISRITKSGLFFCAFFTPSSMDYAQ